MKKLKLILWKNSIIRRRHWFLTLVEITMPILLFTLLAYGRSKISGLKKIHIEQPTYHDVSTTTEIYSHLNLGDLHLWYTPHTSFTDNIIRNVQSKLQIPGDAVMQFNSSSELVAHFGKSSTNLTAVVTFTVKDTQHMKYDLTIYDKHLAWDTDKLFSPLFILEDGRASDYIYRGYAALQIAIDMSYIELFYDKSYKDVTFTLQQFPDPPRLIDSGLNQLFINFLPLITIFSFIFLFPAVLQRVGEEKFSGTKEFLKMVGLKSWTIWLGWFLHAMCTNLFSIIVIVILMKIPCWGAPYPPIEHSNGVVLFIFLCLYCMAAITFCFLIASIFSKPSVATVVGMIIWIISYFIPQSFISSQENLKWKNKILFALFPNMALYFGYSSISVYEMRETGIQWDNIFQPGSGDGNDITMGTVFFSLIFDTVLFMLFTLYIENVKPGECGIAKPYSFPLSEMKNFLVRCVSSMHRFDVSPEHESLDIKDIEKGRTPCMQINNLYKKFYNHVAVDGLNMNINKNRITVLLGQNGAGKTTVLSILTGMTDATSGVVKINGKDIRTHTDEVRKLIGLCPQHNLLFPDLTVLEHFTFFAKLKGSAAPEKDAKEMLKSLDMENKGNDMTNVLSGGMKRKLCLGMALIGNSEVLILDEPTSGMDPEARRKIWNLLLENRKSRTILITTHFMEEADVLGDWIAIMAHGRLQCYGTPLQLKTKYNTGCHLSLLLKTNANVTQITQVVEDHFPEAKLIRKTEDSVVYLLPLIEKDKIKYKNLIVSLENEQTNLGVAALSMNETTLNDVFLKARDEIEESTDEYDSRCSEGISNLPDIHGIQRDLNIVRALLKKRFDFLKKKYYWFIPSIVVAFSIFLLAIWLAVLNNNYSEDEEPPLNFTLGIYGKTRVLYGGQQSSDPTISRMREFYKDAVLKENGQALFQENVTNGIIKSGISNVVFYKKHLIVAAEFNSIPNRNSLHVNSMFSAHALHSIPISINLAMNALVQTFNETSSIAISNTPLRSLHSQHIPKKISAVDVTSTWLILFPLSMFFFMSNFLLFPNSEVTTNFMQIQTIAGIKTYIYWFVNVFFDFLFSVVLLTMLFSFAYLINWAAYNSEAFEGQDLGTIFCVFIIYIFVGLPFTYLLSYKKSVTAGFGSLLMLGIFTGIIPTIVIVAMEFSQTDYYIQIANSLKLAFTIFSPQFGLSYICVKFSKKYVENFNWKHMEPNLRNHFCKLEHPCCSIQDDVNACDKYKSYFINEDMGIGQDLLTMFVGFFIYFLILVFLNTEMYKKLLHFLKYIPWCLLPLKKQKPKTEETETKNASSDDATLLVKDVTKTFGRKTIVKDLQFHLKKNKCFGLLGVNGAGKSTTFRMLTKYLFFDKGDVLLKSSQTSIPIAKREYCENIGYCPQEDCLNYFLTGRELLYTMACIKGYSNVEAKKITDHFLTYFGLEKYADKPCLEYSGGNKRKLSSCLAFLGCPEVILLDEPTNGVDPASRRNFWRILSSFKEIKDTSFLLCSHSMEECENLCDEIAIMKNGEIKDQGSLMALKNKYQKGFKIVVKLNSGSDKIDDVKKEIEQLGADLLDEYAETLTFQMRDTELKLSQLFDILEELKNKYNGGGINNIEDYTINQISLEDVFLSVAEKV